MYTIDEKYRDTLNVMLYKAFGIVDEDGLAGPTDYEEREEIDPEAVMRSALKEGDADERSI